MKNFWMQLQDRERWMLTVGVITCFIYALYLIVFAPLSAAVYQSHKTLADKKELLAWMKIAEKTSISKQQVNHINNAQLPGLLTEAIKKNQLSGFAYQIQQSQHDVIQLSFTEVPFNALMQWLMVFCKSHCIEVESLSAEKTSTAGIVKLSVELKAK